MDVLFYAPDLGATKRWIDPLSAALPGARVRVWSPDTASVQADYALISGRAGTDALAGQQRLKAVVNLGAGVDSLLARGVLPPGALLLRLADAGKAAQMAEYVCHMLLRYTRRFDFYDAHQRAQQWLPQPIEPRSAFPVGVMGLGAIGARVAEAVASFGYPTHGWARSERTLKGVTLHAGPGELKAFLKATRVLVCVLPLTADTRGILSRANLAQLQPGGYVINVARSAHIVDADLLTMLDRGELAGAALDVFATEPLPREHRYWTHPKVTVTPHVAADTSPANSVALIAEQLLACERGETPVGLVDLARGY